jgi:hypothetical protein
MIAKLAPTQISEFESVLEACEQLSTEQARRDRIEAVRDSAVRGLLHAALAEPVSARNLRPGIRLGEFELVERLGAGGFGEVWSAKRRGASAPAAAIKIVRSEHLQGRNSERYLGLFQQEIERHRTLQHPAIVQLLEAGTAHLSVGGNPIPYLVMELWRGWPLQDACRGQGIEEKLQCLIAICQAVQFAHQHGLMHLDLKPENILVKRDRGRLEPKLLDFGIARAFRADRPFDPARFGAGTLPYKAPEQIEPALGGEDFRTDVHALGVLLFQVLTDHLPYPIQTGSAEEYRDFILHGPRLDLRHFDQSSDPKLNEICGRAMAVEPSRRYDSPLRLAEALRARLPSRLKRRKRGALAVAAVMTAVALWGVPAWHNQVRTSDWKVFAVNCPGLAGLRGLNWTDICWLGDEGWLCGAFNEDSAAGKFVGSGILLHTINGGQTWQEIPRSRFPTDRGVIAGFEDKLWNGVGPLSAIEVSVETNIDGSQATNVWLAGVTGIYRSDNPGSDDSQWVRVTPKPDADGDYAFFTGFVQIDRYRELYAFGWQGVSYRDENGNWTVPFPTHRFAITSLLLGDRTHRELWATANGGTVPTTNWGSSQDTGAIFHYAWPSTNWERVDLSALRPPIEGTIFQMKAAGDMRSFVAVGSNGLIARGSYRDGRWTWSRVRSNTSQALESLDVDPDLNVWAVGSEGVILRSADGGQTWSERPCYDPSGRRLKATLSRIKFLGRRGWILGGGTLLTYDKP